MDFFHCNTCYNQPGAHNNKTFWLTSCGHSFCEECANASDSVCRVCHNSCKYLALESDIPDVVKSYFTDSIKELKKTLKILLIQNKHCKIYMDEYVPKLEAKYLAAKLAIEKQKVELESAKVTIEQRNSEIDSLKKILKKMETEMHDMKKQFCRLSQRTANLSPILPSTPSSYASTQEGMSTPRSGVSINSLPTRLINEGGNRSGKGTFLSPSMASPFQEKKRLTAMELLLKSKDTPVRGSPRQNILGTPPSNQTFKMTINNSPESSEYERWSSSRSMPMMKSQNYQRTPNNLSEKWSNSRRSVPLIPHSQLLSRTPNKMDGSFFK